MERHHRLDEFESSSCGCTVRFKTLVMNFFSTSQRQLSLKIQQLMNTKIAETNGNFSWCQKGKQIGHFLQNKGTGTVESIGEYILKNSVFF